MIATPIRRPSRHPAGTGTQPEGLQEDASGASGGRGPDVLVAVGKVLVRHGLVRLLESDGLATRISVSAGAEQTRGWIRRRWFDIVLIDPEQAEELGDAQLQAGSRRTLLVTEREHVGEQPLAGRDVACGMLSEAQGEAATLTLLRIVTRCCRPGFERDRCGDCLALRTWQKERLPLSPREMDIFLRIGAGFGPRRIAGDLGVSVKTVESHREKIKQKLGLKDGDALLCAAMRWRRGYRIG